MNVEPRLKFITEDARSPILKVSNLTCGYKAGHSVIEQISFEVYRGERIALIGPNGAGKSTFFKTLVGIIPHDKGHVSIHGEDCQKSHTLMGYVPQVNEIDWRFPATVYDVVMMGRVRKVGWLRWPGRQDREAVYAALEQVGLMDLSQKQIGQLSGGQQRRVFIARALVQGTDVLLLDEPFSGVDITGEHEIMDVLDHLKDEGITTLLATHDLSLAATQFDRVLLIYKTIVAYGTAQDVFQAEILQRAYGKRTHFFLDSDIDILPPQQGHTEVV